MDNKLLKKSAAVSVLISLMVFVIEGIFAYTKGNMPIQTIIWGGECSVSVGLGFSVLTVYPMSVAEVISPPSKYVSLNIYILIFFALVMFMVYMILKSIENKRKK